MALDHSPRISKEGLVFCLDAGNIKSYTGVGTSWYDVSGGSEYVSLINNPLYNTSNGGVLIFDGANDYGTFSSPSIVPSGNQISIDIWNYGVDSRQSSAFSAYNSGNRTLNIHLPWDDSTVYWDAGNVGTLYDRIQKSATDAEYQGWHHWVFTKNSTTGSMKIYHDGSLWHSDISKTRTINVSDFAEVARFQTTNTLFHNGKIASMKFYNRELTEDEIQINFNAVKTRFGF